MTDRPMLFLLHGLGCSARTWRFVVDGLADEFECVPLDLPGHGDASGSDQLTVEQMADWLIGEVLDRKPARWALVGHSMGGKVATIVTARTERGVAGLTRPLALVLVASSPLAQEPMDEANRDDMIDWCADGPVSESHARTYVEANLAGPLPAERFDDAVADVQRVSRDAWLAWLERGSREDWSRDAGPVHTPTLVVAGAEDGDLDADAQREFVVPRVAATNVVEVEDAAHLIPLEQPVRLAGLIRTHLTASTATRDALPPALVALIDSDRVSSRTRAALLDRVLDPADGLQVFDDGQAGLLTALLARVIPQRGARLDLVARIDASLAAEEGDGWRFAELPDDPEAWRRGLDTLASASEDFTELDGSEQDAWVERLIAGKVGSDEPGRLTSEQMVLWFEDVRAQAIRTWVSHPATAARIGYDGFANGGDGRRRQGYLRVGADEREPWQQDLAANT